MCASLPSSPPTAIWVASAAKQQPCSDSNQTNLLILQFLFPNKECVSDFPEQVDFRFAESFFSFYFSSEWENSFSQSWVVFFWPRNYFSFFAAGTKNGLNYFDLQTLDDDDVKDVNDGAVVDSLERGRSEVEPPTPSLPFWSMELDAEPAISIFRLL